MKRESAYTIIVYRDVEQNRIKTLKGRLLGDITDDSLFLSIVDDFSNQFDIKKAHIQKIIHKNKRVGGVND